MEFIEKFSFSDSDFLFVVNDVVKIIIRIIVGPVSYMWPNSLWMMTIIGESEKPSVHPTCVAFLGQIGQLLCNCRRVLGWLLAFFYRSSREDNLGKSLFALDLRDAISLIDGPDLQSQGWLDELKTSWRLRTLWFGCDCIVRFSMGSRWRCWRQNALNR